MKTKPRPEAIRTFDQNHQAQIAMPMGGIGSGCICLNGHGGFQDFSIDHAPHTTAMPDGHGYDRGAFATLHVKGDKPTTKLLEGPMPPGKVYNQGLLGMGHRKGGFEGLPRFEACTFTAEYPFGHVELTHPHVPLRVSTTGFSPFIPLDDHHSSLPVALLEYTFTNTSDATVEAEFAFHSWHLPHLMQQTFSIHQGVPIKHRGKSRNAPIPGFGVHMDLDVHDNSPHRASVALGVVGHDPKIKAMWFRSGWFDTVTQLWREVSSGGFTENDGSNWPHESGNNGGSVMVPLTIQPGESVSVPVVYAWHVPNPTLTSGRPAQQADCGPGCDCNDDEKSDGPPPPPWRPYYAGYFDDAAAVATYVRDRYDELRGKTRAFRDALSASTVPAEVIDAVSSTLAILRSPTVLRQENGNLWGWEGCMAQVGCCPGTCTHVWNYAQALPHLFPMLERTLREQELIRSMDELGHVNFRAALPDGPVGHQGHPAADGQLGGIMKVYRDYTITGDMAWLRRVFPLAKRSLDYAIQRWDPDRLGVLVEPHHNTWDVEFWGPNSMCSTVYIGALVAMAELCVVMDQPGAAEDYRALAQRGAACLKDELFNGEYMHQKVMWQELKDRSFAEKLGKLEEPLTDPQRVEQAEGPSHQYGRGCMSEAVVGQWMAELYGLDTPLSKDVVESNLDAIVRHNWKPDLSDHACTQRPGYAMGHEAGLIICTWPRGGRPTISFPYPDEVFTSIEYHIASHLIMHGQVDQALPIIKGARDRYDGKTRNPFNEYECGNYYARALSSYALLLALSGFQYNAATRQLTLDPKLLDRPFVTFFSTASAWGTVTLDGSQLTVEVCEGKLQIEALNVAGRNIAVDACVVDAGEPRQFKLV